MTVFWFFLFCGGVERGLRWKKGIEDEFLRIENVPTLSKVGLEFRVYINKLNKMETSKFSKTISPILSSTMTFSSKNTENNSTCAQSLLIEGPTNAQNTNRSLQSPEVPGESTRDNAFTFYSKSNGLPCSKPK